MAEDGQDESESLTPVQAVAVLVFLVLLPLGLVAVGVHEIRDAWVNIDTSSHCSPESNRCLQRTQGVVEEPESPYDVGLRYDDGRRHLGVDFDDGWQPRLGTRVLLERFRGDVVSVYDPVSERRHKAGPWPSKEDAVGPVFLIGFALYWLVIGILLLGGLLLKPLLNRWSLTVV